mmetsp:Transcript_5577/g.15975  ORF Transcript_5577/g.15975 Transcript_5577/m.15975 type:complete len:111 (-) Transcript_5577:365-697(-)
MCCRSSLGVTDVSTQCTAALQRSHPLLWQQAACFAEGSSLRHSAEETLQEDKEGPGPDSTVLNRKTPMAHDKDGNVQAGKVDTGKDGKGVEEKTSHPTKASGEGSKGSKK